jgi:hypothetical protein
VNRYIITLALLATILPVAGVSSPAMADGALAVGTTSDVVKDGIAFGYVVDSTSSGDARTSAMQYCSTFKRAPKAAAQCQLVATFKNECFAIAMDPKDGTPGAGWAIAGTKVLAESRALANCRVTAGTARREYCEIDVAKCDGGESR